MLEEQSKAEKSSWVMSHMSALLQPYLACHHSNANCCPEYQGTSCMDIHRSVNPFHMSLNCALSPWAPRNCVHCPVQFREFRIESALVSCPVREQLLSFPPFVVPEIVDDAGARRVCRSRPSCNMPGITPKSRQPDRGPPRSKMGANNLTSLSHTSLTKLCPPLVVPFANPQEPYDALVQDLVCCL